MCFAVRCDVILRMFACHWRMNVWQQKTSASQMFDETMNAREKLSAVFGNCWHLGCTFWLTCYALLGWMSRILSLGCCQKNCTFAGNVNCSGSSFSRRTSLGWHYTSLLERRKSRGFREKRRLGISLMWMWATFDANSRAVTRVTGCEWTEWWRDLEWNYANSIALQLSFSETKMLNCVSEREKTIAGVHSSKDRTTCDF